MERRIGYHKANYKSMEKIVFTPSLFFKHATCPHWIWHDKFGDPSKKGEVPALTEKLIEQGVFHEEEYVKNLKFKRVHEIAPEDAFAHTFQLMKDGAHLIYQGEIQYEANGVLYRGRPDLLEKHTDCSSDLGNYYYEPVDIKSSKDIKKEQLMQLVLYAKILEAVQGRSPTNCAIINKEHERISIEIKEKIQEKTFLKIDEILQVIRGSKPPLKLSASCKSSPWFDQCLAEAKKANDIALIYKLDARAQKDLRAEGINTVVDAAHMEVANLPKIAYASLPTLERTKLQAQSLLTEELRWIKKPNLVSEKLNIYFDIEGDPLLGVQYLWGFWVVGDAKGKYAKFGKVKKAEDGKYFIYFLAEKPEDEKEMWKTLLRWLDLLPKDKIAVFHFHIYEVTQCKLLEEMYGGSDALHNFMTHFIDLSSIVQSCLILPLYFYSIKDIAKSKFLNFKWRHAKAGGAQSVFWYENWLEKGDRKILDDIVNYNEDDVRATEYLHNWLVESSGDACISNS